MRELSSEALESIQTDPLALIVHMQRAQTELNRVLQAAHETYEGATTTDQHQRTGAHLDYILGKLLERHEQTLLLLEAEEIRRIYGRTYVLQEHSNTARTVSAQRTFRSTTHHIHTNSTRRERRASCTPSPHRDNGHPGR